MTRAKCERKGRNKGLVGEKFHYFDCGVLARGKVLFAQIYERKVGADHRRKVRKLKVIGKVCPTPKQGKFINFSLPFFAAHTFSDITLSSPLLPSLTQHPSLSLLREEKMWKTYIWKRKRKREKEKTENFHLALNRKFFFGASIRARPSRWITIGFSFAAAGQQHLYIVKDSVSDLHRLVKLSHRFYNAFFCLRRPQPKKGIYVSSSASDMIWLFITCFPPPAIDILMIVLKLNSVVFSRKTSYFSVLLIYRQTFVNRRFFFALRLRLLMNSKLEIFMNFHGPPFSDPTHSSFAHHCADLQRSAPSINEQKKSYKIKIIDYTTRTVSQKEGKGKEWEKGMKKVMKILSLALFLNIKFL